MADGDLKLFAATRTDVVALVLDVLTAVTDIDLASASDANDKGTALFVIGVQAKPIYYASAAEIVE